MHQDIREAGASLVVISPQLAEHSAKIAKRHKLTFDVLSDPGNQVARQFGIVHTLPEELQELYRGFKLDLAHFNGDDSWTLPMPARFIIRQGGTIASAEADPDYTKRPEPSETVDRLRDL